MSKKRKKNSGNPSKGFAERMEAAQRQVDYLLGCEWGKQLSTPDDTEPCTTPANHMVTVHNGPAHRTFKLCDKHNDRLAMETTPRGEGG